MQFVVAEETLTRMHTQRIFLACLFLALTTFAMLTTNFPTSGWPGGDGRDYATITEALVNSGSFDISHASRPQRGEDDYTVIRKEDGSMYSIYPMGRALAQVPLLAASRAAFKDSRSVNERVLADNLAFSLTSALLYGLAGVLMFVLLKEVLGLAPGISLFGTALYCFATLALPFAKIHQVENLQAVLFMAMVIAGLKPGRWSIAVICFCFGWLVITKPPSAVALPVFLYLFFHGRLWQRSPWPARIVAAIATLGTAGLFFYYNWLRSGDATAAYAVSPVANIEYAATSVWGTLRPLLFGTERNLFINNPVLALAIPGLFLVKNRPYLITTLGLWLTMLVFYGASGNTNWGAYVGNARYTMPFLFLLIPPVLYFLQFIFGKVSAIWGKCLLLTGVAALLLASFWVQLLYTSFSEFHVKQFEKTYNRYARQYDMPRIEEATRQLVFLRKLAATTESCQHPTGLEQFSYPAADAKTASFSAVVLKTFPPIWFCKDYLFLNEFWFQDVAWLPRLRWVLLVLCVLSLLLAGGLFRSLTQSRTIIHEETG